MILVVGAGGLVGRKIVDRWSTEDVVALGHEDLDVTDAVAVRHTIGELQPSVVINCAGNKAADAMERDPTTGWQVNAVAPGILAGACELVGALLIHLSADYVFGEGFSAPIPVAATATPLSRYGASKLAGERAVVEHSPRAYVVRTSSIFSVDDPGFVATMLRLGRERDQIEVVSDQRSSPTWVNDLLVGLQTLVRVRPPGGVFHCTNSGDASWAELATATFAEALMPTSVRATTASSQNQIARRPSYSVLGNEEWLAAGLGPMRPWKEALHEAFAAQGDPRQPEETHQKGSR